MDKKWLLGFTVLETTVLHRRQIRSFEMLFSDWSVHTFGAYLYFEILLLLREKRYVFNSPLQSYAKIYHHKEPYRVLLIIVCVKKLFLRTWKNMLIFKPVIKGANLCIFNYGCLEFSYVLKCDEQKCSPCRKT